jgi:hypothetical protein
MKKVLSIALAAIIMALPLPASQLLAAGASPAPLPVANTQNGADSNADFAVLLADPFLIDQLSYQRPASFIDLAKV